MLSALLTVVMGITDELNTTKRSKTPSLEQLQLRTRWTKYQQEQNTLQKKITEFCKSL